MPTVLVIKKLLFVIHTRDHQPPHVEVYFGNPETYEAWAKVRIDKVELLEAEGFTSSDLDQIVRICQARQKFLSSEWRRIHGEV